MDTEQNNNPGTGTIILLAAALAAAYAVYFFLTGTLPQILGYSLDKLYISAAFMGSGFVLLPLIIYVKRRYRVPAGFIFQFPSYRLMILLVILVFSLKIIVNPFFQSEIHFKALNEGKLMLNNFGMGHPDLGMLMNFAGNVLFVPVFEEIFWRGQIQTLLLKKFSPSRAVILTSVFSSILYLKPGNLFPLFICGLVFGIVYFRTQTLGAAIFLHSFLNFLNFISKYISVNATDEIFLLNYLLFILSVIVVMIITRYLPIRETTKTAT